MKDMSKEYEIFERVVHDLFDSRLPKDYRLRQSAKYVGVITEHEHQIDFSFEGEVAGLHLLFLGECKFHKRPISLDKIMAFGFRLWDIKAHKGIFVSSNGFQEGAYKIAEGTGMALVVCRNKQLSFELSRNSGCLSVDDFIDPSQNQITSRSLEFGLLTSDKECRVMDGFLLFDYLLQDGLA